MEKLIKVSLLSPPLCQVRLSANPKRLLQREVQSLNIILVLVSVWLTILLDKLQHNYTSSALLYKISFYNMYVHNKIVGFLQKCQISMFSVVIICLSLECRVYTAPATFCRLITQTRISNVNLSDSYFPVSTRGGK